ncbi:MAG: XkdQ/YqbQ family protein [Cetobacterium sp.]
MRAIMSDKSGIMFDVSNIIKMPFNLKSSIDNYLNILDIDFFLDNISEVKSILEFTTKIYIYDSKNLNVFSGFLFERTISDNYFVKCKFYNEGYYINKNEDTFQFENKNMKECIIEIFERFSIKYSAVETPDIMIDEIFFNRALGSVISDFVDRIAKETGKDYILTINEKGEFYFGKSNKQKYIDGELESKEYFINKNNDIFNPINKFLNLNYTESIGNMVTKVKMYQKDGNDGVLGVSELENKDNLDNYGVIQKTFSLEEGETKDPKEILKNELEKLSKIQKKLDLNIISDLNLKAMDIIKIRNKDYYIDGDFYVLEVDNNINSKDDYTASVKLELLEKKEV